MDEVTVFLNRNLEEYMEQPDGYIVSGMENLTCVSCKSPCMDSSNCQGAET